MLLWTPTGLEPASRHPTKGQGLSQEPCRPRIERASGAGGENGFEWRQRVRRDLISYFKTKTPNLTGGGFCSGAGDGARTRYLHLGKVALYQMSYARRTCVL